MVNSGAVFVLWTSGFLFGLCASTVKALGRTDWAIRSDYMRNASTLHCPNALPIPCINHCHHSQYLVQILEPQYKTIQEYRRSNLNFRDNHIGDKLALTKLLKNLVYGNFTLPSKILFVVKFLRYFTNSKCLVMFDRPAKRQLHYHFYIPCNFQS